MNTVHHTTLMKSSLKNSDHASPEARPTFVSTGIKAEQKEQKKSISMMCEQERKTSITCYSCDIFLSR